MSWKNNPKDLLKYRIIDDDGNEKILLSNQQLFESADSKTIRLDEIFENNVKESLTDPVTVSGLDSPDINSVLFRIAEQAHTAKDMTQFFSEIHRIIAKLTYAENFFIALYDERRQIMSFPYTVDIASDIDVSYLAKLPIEVLKNTMTGYMLRTGQMLHANAELMNSLIASGEINDVGETSHQWLGFPLKEGDKILGALVVQSYDSQVGYQTKDIELLQFVSQHVATALSRKQADEALKESEKKFREVLENSRVISYKFNLALNVYEYVSKSIESVFGFTSDEYLATDYEDAKLRIHPDDRELYREQFINIINQTTRDNNFIVPIVEYRWRHKDGVYRWYSDTRTVVCDEDKVPVAIIGSVRDISELKVSEQKLRETEEELHKMQELENIGILAGGLAHDFNNILTGIFGNLSLAKMSLSKHHPGFKYLEKTEQSMDRATRLTKQLLTFAKGGEPIREEVDLTTLIEETTLFDLTGSNVKPVFNFSKKQLDVSVDKGQIQQLISNLVINANQAMPDGGHLYISLQQVELSDHQVGTLKKGRYIKVEIRDEGRGIERRKQSRIFDPYFTTKPAGNGLGLTTVYSIITKHNGYIKVDSVLGEGTTFLIYLPSLKKQPQELPPATTNNRNRDDEKRNILVMDDDEMILTLVTSILELNNFTVTTATDGNQALEIYQQALNDKKWFDAVIMDLTIPGGMGGKDAVIEFLKIDAHAKCIVSSGYADDPIMAHYSDYGFKGVISKPFAVADLISMLDQVINQQA